MAAAPFSSVRVATRVTATGAAGAGAGGTGDGWASSTTTAARLAASNPVDPTAQVRQKASRRLSLAATGGSPASTRGQTYGDGATGGTSSASPASRSFQVSTSAAK